MCQYPACVNMGAHSNHACRSPRDIQRRRSSLALKELAPVDSGVGEMALPLTGKLAPPFNMDVGELASSLIGEGGLRGPD